MVKIIHIGKVQQEILDLFNKGYTGKEIAIKRNTSSQAVSKIRRKLIEKGLLVETYNGYKMNSNGYIEIKVGPKYVLLHRHNWIQKYGEIPKGHIIHHIDLDKHNNDINNLMCMSQKEHLILHHRIKKELAELTNKIMAEVKIN